MGSGGLTVSVVNGGGAGGGGGGGGGMADAGLPLVATPGGGGGAAADGSRRRSRSLLAGWSDQVRGTVGRSVGGGGGDGGGGGGGGGGGVAGGGITWSSSGGGKRGSVDAGWRRPSPRGGVWALTFGLALAVTLLLFGRRSGGGGGGGGGGDPLAALSPAQRAAAVAAAARALASTAAAAGVGIAGGGRGGVGMAAADAAALGAVDDAAGAAVGVDPVAALERWTDDAYARSRLRVYVYDLPGSYNAALVRESHERPPPIRDPLCDASFYSAEVSLHRFLLSSAVRTRDPEEADFFYVPIYTTCFLMTHQPNNLETTGRHFATGMHHVINEVRCGGGGGGGEGDERRMLGRR